MPEVSVVILNLNGGDLTRQAVSSVLGQLGVEPEVIVVDNGSTDGSRERIAEEFKGKIKMIENPENLGFSPANNQGFQAATGNWVCILNNDAVADPLWLKFSLNCARSGQKTGIVVPRIVRYSDRDELDGIGVGFWRDGLSRAKHRGEIDSPRLNRETVLIPSGCACMLSRQMLDELSGFDPDFFIYSEDTDLGIRAFLSGWQCRFEPKAVIYHRYSKTTAIKSGYSAFKLYQVERNRLWILFRYYSPGLILVSPITSLIRLIFQALHPFSTRNRPYPLPIFSGLPGLFKAFLHAFLSVPNQLKYRRKYRSSRKAKQDLSRLLLDQFIPLKEISRLD